MSVHTREATICTVSTPFHKRLLYYNYQLTRRLNPGHRAGWQIVDNAEIHVSRQRIRQLLYERGMLHNEKTYGQVLDDERRRYHDAVDMHEYIGAERILPGIPLAEVLARLPATSPAEDETPAQFDYRKDKNLQSYHHAYNIEMALQNTDTRFAIVLDPDLYVVRPNWLTETLAWMDAHRIAIFGVPWHPRYFQKIRYFPAMHFMVIDFSRVSKKDISLAPDLLGTRSGLDPTFWRKYNTMGPSRFLHLLAHLREAVSEDRDQRRMIGSARDTGYAVFAMTQRANTKVETVCPVFDSADGFVPPTVSRLQENRITRRLMPDEKSYLPLKDGYVADTGFRERGYPDFRGIGWEEFVWKGDPFAFHIRGEVHRSRVGGVDESSLLDGLNAILARHRGGRLEAWEHRTREVVPNGRVV